MNLDWGDSSYVLLDLVGAFYEAVAAIGGRVLCVIEVVSATSLLTSELALFNVFFSVRLRER